MLTIFDAIDNDFEKFIAAAEEVFPDFKKKMETKLKEDADAKLLQEEQNLTEAIENRHNEHERILKNIANLKIELDKLYEDANKILSELDILAIKRSEIHKKWIELHPSKTDKSIDNIIKDVREAECGVMVKSEVKRPDLHKAFKLIYEYATERGSSFLCKNHLSRIFKNRFDNLCHARCETTEMFGFDWMIGDVIDALKEKGEQELAFQIADFYTWCESKKK